MRGKLHDFNPSLLGLIPFFEILALARGGGSTARLNELFFIPIASICIYMVFFCASESATSDYALSMNASTLFFCASDFILLRKHQRELRMIGQRRPTSEMSFIERLWWATNLVLTARGLGWAHEPTSHLAPRPTSSRTRFIISQLLWILFYFMLFDVASIFRRANPCFGRGGPSLTAYGWMWQTTAWLYIFAGYAMLSMIYAGISIVAVAVGLTEPREWPHLFGSPRDAYTVRKSWGRVWHQMMRKLLTGHMDFFAKVLHLPKGTFTTYFKLFGSFFISGLIHYAGDYMLFQDWSGTSLRFFLLQAVAITFEDAIIGLAGRLGYTKPTPFFKLVGFIWVFAWFTFSIPIWIDPVVHTGAMDEDVNVSLIMGLWRGEWTPKRAV
ncbi:membrane bound O-acyl transferase family-domain-containing protein [Flammula alnicola]|nr:membrane bound O-acyl transferase family-domain-containing protein [Flammula alnicola]